MSSAAPPPALPRPSVFLSYASDDRPAARRLRDALAATGLEVWYDESDLGGGDAWDQKIRRQIRDCDYFIPVISAATERRKEGYFRREWRLATERTLDMADDVLFLLPVVIDDTTETGARVPDKFLAVQWLRLPGGNSTPALETVARRMLAGDHHALAPTAPRASARPSAASRPTAAADDAPPPMPPFPHPPEKGGFGHTLRFMAEAFWWLLTAGWLLFKRLPKWARTLLVIWAVATFLTTRCSNKNIHIGDDAPPARPTAAQREQQKALRASVEKLSRGANGERRSFSTADLAQLRAEIARTIAAGGRDGAGKPLVVIPFAPANSDDPAEKFAGSVFASLYGQLVLSRADDVGLSPEPGAGNTDADLVARGKKLAADFVLAATLTGESADRALAVRLLNVADGTVTWTNSFPIAGAAPISVAEKIDEAITRALPAKRP
ncbi:MAG TPA: toll/interleukin-1 receptor domain-containing protein [Opitutaceae bacterium]|nr:toll/interleukin-1 receptor domain-containing protein [Opitutaceae bacterium]